MAAPLVHFLAKKGLREIHKRSPGGLVGAVAILLALVMFAWMAMISMIVGVFGGAAATAANNECAPGISPVSMAAIKGISPTALDAYRKAGAATDVDWVYVAAIGFIESGHGTHGGASVASSGEVSPHIIGIRLDGSGATMAIRDTDNGRWDGDTAYDRAVGPMQFIPSTWESMKRDGNTDGVADPHNLYDAALATAFYLKRSGAPGNMRAAIYTYNHSETYVDEVMAKAEEYRAAEEEAADQVIFATLNILTSLGPSAVRSDIDKIVNAAQPDILALQEMGHRPGDLIKTPGYKMWRGDGDTSASRQDILLYKEDRFEPVRLGTRLMHVSQVIPSATRYVNFGTFRDLATGSVFSVVSGHSVAHIDRNGSPGWTGRGILANGNTDRTNPLIALYAKYMSEMQDLVTNLKGAGPVIVMGDYNVDYRDDARVQDPIFPYSALGKVGLAATYRTLGQPQNGWPTFGVRTIDYIFHSSGLSPAAHQVVRGFNSDHNAVVAQFGQAGPDNDVSGLPPVMTLPTGQSSVAAWLQPLAQGSYTLTSKFGPRVHPVTGDLKLHDGLDYGAAGGTPVTAVAAGTATVTSSSWAGPHYVTIDHGMVEGKRVVSGYGHMASATVKTGDVVTGGQQVGTVGTEGLSTGNHLHLMILVNDTAVDPEVFLATAGAPSSDGLGGCGTTDYTGLATGSGSWGGFQNGKIPADQLCPVDFQSSALLRCDAAKAMSDLNRAFQADFGKNVGPIGGYRSYEDQVICREAKGSLCAVPGTSNHGWGMAADMGANINSYTSPEHRWMVANAGDFGWVLPSWAQANGSKPEPWHWEFGAIS